MRWLAIIAMWADAHEVSAERNLAALQRATEFYPDDDRRICEQVQKEAPPMVPGHRWALYAFLGPLDVPP